MINKSLSLMLGLSLLLGLGLTYGLKADDEADSGGHGYGPVAVSLASVQQISLPQQLDAVGELEAAAQIAVAAEASGRVTALHFDSGQQVKAGELLVQLNDAVEQAELLQQEAQLLAAESAYRRLVSLAADNLASREALDNALAERDMARAAVARTQALIAQKAIKAPSPVPWGSAKFTWANTLAPVKPSPNWWMTVSSKSTLRSAKPRPINLSLGRHCNSGQTYAPMKAGPPN